MYVYNTTWPRRRHSVSRYMMPTHTVTITTVENQSITHFNDDGSSPALFCLEWILVCCCSRRLVLYGYFCSLLFGGMRGPGRVIFLGVEQNLKRGSLWWGGGGGGDKCRKSVVSSRQQHALSVSGKVSRLSHSALMFTHWCTPTHARHEPNSTC